MCLLKLKKRIIKINNTWEKNKTLVVKLNFFNYYFILGPCNAKKFSKSKVII